MKTSKRRRGYYTVCHPSSMSIETTGYWNGKSWEFPDETETFDDDDLQWIQERVEHTKEDGD